MAGRGLYFAKQGLGLNHGEPIGFTHIHHLVSDSLPLKALNQTPQC
ncbi:global transcription factor group [Corchorus olitorius]|uniref:Global transcription factor group n=1 Tax=Corchorus olitorius TaxID=93759 RepID=A0A1R3HK38_9ROSI|nr:global transcription factor group [Corchorus olitorius]